MRLQPKAPQCHSVTNRSNQARVGGRPAPCKVLSGLPTTPPTYRDVQRAWEANRMSAEPLPTTLLQHALAYAARGLEIFPLKPDKAPLIDGGMNASSSDPDKVLAWWQQWPNALIGCRVPVDRIILDVDPRHGGDQTLQGLEDHYGKIRAGRVHLSGRGDGGAHYWFELPKGVTLSIKGLDEWARENGTGHPILKNDGTPTKKWVSGIDLLTHAHRYTILPPSPHAATGAPYTWQSTLPAVPLPGWLLTILTKPDPEPEQETERPHLSLVTGDESPADWYTRTTNWTDILTRHGWMLIEGDGNSDGSKWRHPHATATYSASIQHGCLFVHTPNTEFDETTPGEPAGYTRFRAYAILEHAGDLSAAARAVNEMRGNPHGHLDPAELLPAASDETWPEPQPLTTTKRPPEFPIDTLPAVAQQHVRSVADDLQTSIDLPAVLYLAALSTIAAPKRRIHVHGRWSENLNLYLVVALPPGAGKSPAVKQLLYPIHQREQHLRELAAPLVAKTQQARRMLEKRMANAEKKGDTAEAQRALLDLIETPERELPRLVANNATPEALEQLLSQNDGTISLINTEGGPFDQMTGQYSDRSNLDVYLQAWSGDHIAVDRIGREHLTIQNPRLTVALTVQPAVIEKLRDRPELAGRGLTARFMYSLPVNNVGWRDLNRAAINDETSNQYGQHLSNLIDAQDKFSNFSTLELEPAALDQFLTYRQTLETRRRPGQDLQHLAEWSIKLESSVVRTAALLAIANEHPVITAETMAAAIRIGDYWIGHAHAVAELWGTDPVTALALRILEWAQRHPDGEFSHRDAYLAHRSAAPRSVELDGPLELLESAGWVRRVRVERRLSQGGRPPSPRYQVRPK